VEQEKQLIVRQATLAGRRALEAEYSEQLEGLYNILPDGRVLDTPVGTAVVRGRLLDMMEHFRAGGAAPADSVARVVRELAFTTFNRFVALKMAERRGLVRPCVSAGLASEGIKELADCAPGLADAFPDGGYRLLLEAVMDEVSLGLKILFDRRSPAGSLWPRPPALTALLNVLNDPALDDVWTDDETIGWAYQFFNGDDPKKMREEANGGAPRNGRELAVRNQFFTPRYVVQFLTDNTLGRIWFEMRRGETHLRDSCPMLVYRPDEDLSSLTRAGKDPRDLSVLDPACGSGHFLLYAYDLLEQIYLEAWEASDGPPFTETGQTLRQDFPTKADLQAAAPALILRHNLFGIEIDPRCAQIAALALWLRAQRSYQALEIPAADRPAIERANIVVAEPMPGEPELLNEFLATVEPPPLRELVRAICDSMRLAGEAGSLLRVEKEIEKAISAAHEKAGPVFVGIDKPFWDDAEDRLVKALAAYADLAAAQSSSRRRMFAEDASQGIAFVDVCRRRFDAVLMNPPFGEPTLNSRDYVGQAYPSSKQDIYCAFVDRGVEWLSPLGQLGAITSRTGFFQANSRRWREDILLGQGRISLLADLGYGVMQGAMVEASAYCIERCRQ
jgi:hypothetical protein